MRAAPDPPPLLEVRDLHVWFQLPRRQELHALKGLSLVLGSGQRMGLVGESGSGKTSAILGIMGLLPASAQLAGQVLLEGEDILAGGERAIRPHRWSDMAMVSQGTMNALNPVRTVGAQIAEPMVVHGVAAGQEARQRVDELLDMVRLPRATARRYPHELSGGMRQRACLAMALACGPKILLADEPTTALDVVVQAQVLQLLVELCEAAELALILVTHDLSVVAQVCPLAAVLRDGHILDAGPTDSLWQSSRHHYTRMLFDACDFVPRVSTGGDPPARTGAPGPPGRGGAEQPPLLEVADLVVEFPAPRAGPRGVGGVPRRMVRAVDGVSLTVRAGELVALVGESGGGKTTAALAMTKMIASAGGSVRFRGDDITSMPASRLRLLRQRIQMVYQDPYEALDPRFTVLDTVEEPLLTCRPRFSKAHRRERVVQALAAVELAEPESYLDRRPHQLSGGQRQRVALASSLVLEPELLIADEPVSMLDVSLRAGILVLLDGLRRSRGMGILLITHDLSTVARFADRIAVMCLGRVVEEGPAGEVIRSPAHPYTRALLAAAPGPGHPLARAGSLQIGREAPDVRQVPSGCRFRTRCPLAHDACRHTDPRLERVQHDGYRHHSAACLLDTSVSEPRE